ncbi:MAG: Type II secretion system protein F [Planctomycetes bacterium ADurb.Bin401]|nr:MAG: Type II secretion system protein F [Planctomycetes bacterium ADurb.Bin401]
MQVFSYTAKTFAGERKEGVKQAGSLNDVISWLREQGFVPISVNEIANETKKHSSVSFRKKVKSAELSAVYWQLTTMLESGVPVATALGTIAEDIENPTLRHIMKEVLAKVNKGEPFSAGISEYPKVFNKLSIAMILAGETSGNLPGSLKRLAEYFDGRDKFSKKIKVALAYPIFVMIFIVMLIVFMMSFIIPRFKMIFQQLGGELPAFTKMFMDGYDAICHNLVYIAGSVIVIIVSLMLTYRKSKKGHIFFSKQFLVMPLFGKLIKYAFVAIFCKTMSALLAAGVSMLEVFKILSTMSNNDIIKDAVIRTKERIVEGSSISTSMTAANFFPNMVNKMIQVGEESGSLPIMLERTADYYERKVDATLTAMLSLLEPIMIVTVGGVVLLVVLALYMPIFTMGKG